MLARSFTRGGARARLEPSARKRPDAMRITRAAGDVEAECEAVLRSLPRWFGQEDSLLDFVRGTSRLPTFVSMACDGIDGFVTVEQHFPQAFEVVCLAVRESMHGRGIGRTLIEAAIAWARERGGLVLQVKTLAPSHPSTAYAQTRAFYASVGFVPLQVFPMLWGERHPCLQLVKSL
jgi:GNAT superfamily N-acetyltransferase